MALISAVSVKELVSGRPVVLAGSIGKTCPSAYADFSKDSVWMLSDATKPAASRRLAAFTYQARITPPIVSISRDGGHDYAYIITKRLN